jgi:uncharacterized protein YigA (DUF484 family)
MQRLVVLATILVLLVACAPASAARFTRYTETTYPSTREVEVLRTKPVDRPHVELGEIRLRIGKSNENDAILLLKEKAREVGADAIVILGEESRGTVMLPAGGMVFAVPLRDLVSVAIRYKQ